MTAGYQVAQTAHAVADFAYTNVEAFIEWHTRSQYIIALQTLCPETLQQLLENADTHGLTTYPFREPDLENQLTAVAFKPDPRNKRFLSRLPLAGKNTGQTSKQTTDTNHNNTHSTTFKEN